MRESYKCNYRVFLKNKEKSNIDSITRHSSQHVQFHIPNLRVIFQEYLRATSFFPNASLKL